MLMMFYDNDDYYDIAVVIIIIDNIDDCADDFDVYGDDCNEGVVGDDNCVNVDVISVADAGASDVDVDNYVADLVVVVITNDCVNHSNAYEDNDINNNNQIHIF